MWGIKLPGKVLNCLWIACSNVLPTAEALVVKQVNVQRVCSWCHEHYEDAVYTLFTCIFTRDVWKNVGLHSLNQISEGSTVIQILKKAFTTSSKQQCARIGYFVGVYGSIIIHGCRIGKSCLWLGLMLWFLDCCRTGNGCKISINRLREANISSSSVSLRRIG